MLTRFDHSLRVDLGFASERGKRAVNEDYVAACFGPAGARTAHGVVAAIADGVGGHKGGREAAETAVRAFIEGYYAQPETLGVLRGAARSLEAVNSWIAAQSRVDPALAGMATTFSALIVARRVGYVLHVGDTRIYRLNAGGLERLTSDHTAGRGDFSNILRRAIGFEDALHADHAVFTLTPRDRFLLCSDGVHGPLRDATLRDILGAGLSPDDASRSLVTAALDAGGADNATALVLDIVDLPPAQESELSLAVAGLPIGDLPAKGAVVDDFRIEAVISNGRYSRLMKATDQRNGKTVVLKFPHPRAAEAAAFRRAFVKEAWVAARVRSSWIGEVIELPPGRQTRLYSVMPYYNGETLERRLLRAPKIGLAEGVSIATRLARAVAILHRSGIIHRDVKPDNVILTEDGGLRLIDLGVCRTPHLEQCGDALAPGAPSYMAPELFSGHMGDELSDLYGLGVTLYRAFCGAYPYGEVEPFSRPRLGKPQQLCEKRPDLPAWLAAEIMKAVAIDPRDRQRDVLEFAFELENGAARREAEPVRTKPLYVRSPVGVWKGVSFLLLVLLLICVASH